MDSLERRRVQSAFDRAAARYDRWSELQQAVARDLERLLAADAPQSCGWLLDAGCGTGDALPWLAPLAAQRVVALDFAPAMLQAARRRMPGLDAVCADLHTLPFGAGCFDLIWTSLTLQWCRVDAALAECARILAPAGRLYATTLAPATLCELRSAFAAVDAHTHVRSFAPAGEVAAAVAGAGLKQIRLAQKTYTLYRPNLRGVLDDLKGIGANVSAARPAPLTRAAWREVEAHYERLRTPLGLPISYAVLQIVAARDA
ncbi:MAG: methyltransferase domain-containing protein [Rhodocyclaceae bacterium]|nr:methyltransferase domain-containing protein [Rhodocyclaceae bacterium]MBX3670535.1 methyltransferase domain-containing protein [Rhodocyclaceae bacterium]